MNRKKRREAGAIAIEAALSLTIFMLAILALMMGSLLIRAQATMQYALNQTAKEISGYFYLLDKFGLASVISGKTTNVADAYVQPMNDSIYHIVSFTSQMKDKTGKDITEVKEAAQGAIDGNLTEEDIQRIKNISKLDEKSDEYKKAIDDEIESIKHDLDVLKKTDKKEMFKGVLQVFTRAALNTALSKYVTPFVCEALMPKYIKGGDEESFYNATGIRPESISFDGSQILGDGRSISLVVTYTVDASKLTLGFYKKDLHFRHVASTCAWIHGNDSESLITLKGVSKKYDPAYIAEKSEELAKLRKEPEKKDDDEKEEESSSEPDDSSSEDDTEEEKPAEKPTRVSEADFRDICTNPGALEAFSLLTDEEKDLFLYALVEHNKDGSIKYDADGKPAIDMVLFNIINNAESNMDPSQHGVGVSHKIVAFLATDLQNLEDKPENDSWRMGNLEKTVREKVELLKSMQSNVDGSNLKIMDRKDTNKVLTTVDLDTLFSVLATDKGKRPKPEEYLDPTYISNHLNQFKEEGFCVIQTGSTFYRYTANKGKDHSVGRPSDSYDTNGSQFVLPKSVADEIFAQAEVEYRTGGKAAYYKYLENALGFEPGSMSDTNQDIFRVDVTKEQIKEDEDKGTHKYDLRMASGNEGGANGMWVPGGQTSGGSPEAIVNQFHVDESNCTMMFHGRAEDGVDDGLENPTLPWDTDEEGRVDT